MFPLFVRPKSRMGDVKLLMAVERCDYAVYARGVACDEGCGSFGVFVGGGDGEAAAGVEVVLDVDEEEGCHDGCVGSVTLCLCPAQGLQDQGF